MLTDDHDATTSPTAILSVTVSGPLWWGCAKLYRETILCPKRGGDRGSGSMGHTAQAKWSEPPLPGDWKAGRMRFHSGEEWSFMVTKN